MNNFTTRSENASWQFITNLTCCFSKLTGNLKLSAMSSMLVMLFLFSVSSVNAQLNQLNQRSTDLNLCFDQIPEPMSTDEIAILFEEACGDIAPEVTFSEIISGDDCSWNAQYIYDISCGNFSDQIKIVYTGGDQTPPELAKNAVLPTGETGVNACLADRPEGPSEEDIAALFVDNCGNVNVTKSEHFKGDDCGWKGMIIFSIEDDCGNAIDDIILDYTGGDNEDPVLSETPSDFTVECFDTIPSAQSITFTDNCTNGKNKAESSDDVSGLGEGCEGGVIIRTWTATDDCGNSVSHTITITVLSADPAEFEEAEDYTIDCGDVATFEPQYLAYTNNGEGNCNISGEVQGVAEAFEGSCGSFQVNYSFTDECGREITASQTVTVEDNTPPVIDPAAKDSVVECDGEGNVQQFQDWIDSNAEAIAIDDCSNVTWSHEIVVENEECGATMRYEVVFTATDDCGNSSATKGIFIIEDTTDPNIDTEAADMTVECDGNGNGADLEAWLSNNGGASASDMCSDVTWSNNYEALSDDCGETGSATVEFTATDDCGNESKTTATFTIEDTTDPSIDTEAADMTVECDGNGNGADLEAWLSNNGGASASDLCSDVTWSNNYEALSDDCGETGSATVEFTATDDCGNESKTSATFTIEDTTDPSIDTEAADMTVECDGNGNGADLEAWLSSNGGASASDMCSDVTWSNNYEALSDDCGETGSATVEFTATDDCGNESKTTATFTIEDTTDPSIDTEAADMTVECDGNGNGSDLEAWLSNNGGASASDMCSDVTWSNNYEALSDDCGETGSATVEFTATDDCGNESKTSATFTIEDTTDPSIDTEAADMTVECDGNGNAADLAAWLSNNGGASASDMCSDVTWSNNYEALSDDCGATGSATVEFTATDDCGNESKTTATFTIEDTTDPSIDTEAMDMTVECDGNGNAADLEAWLSSNGGASASDMCSDVTWSNNYEALSDDCGATGSATVEFTATDDCGNESKTTATFTIEDTTDPSIDTEAMDMTVECDGNGNAAQLEAWLSSNGGASASDLCSDVIWSNNYEALSDDCGATGSATVEFTATDDCGNESKTTAIFTIEDTTDPSIDTEAMDMTVECDGNGNAADLEAWLSSNGGASASDMCSDVTWSNNYEALSDDCGATGSATVEFTATDDCGNESKTTGTFTIEDTTDPSIDTEAMDMTVECDGNGNAAQLEAWLSSNGGASASDLCSDVTWSNNYEALSDDCGETGSATVEFTATDDCGNESKTTATFTIEDTTDPSIDTEAMDMTVECDGNGNAADLEAWLSSNGGASASDMCSDVTWSNNYEALSDDCGETGSATVEFTATDDCGNESKTTATFTIEDTTDPSIDTEAMDMTVECDGNGNAAQLEAWLSNNGGASASDLCSDVTWSNNYEALSDDCGATGSATVEFTATDDCGNESKTTATFTIEDTTDPSIDTEAMDMTVECDGNGNAADLEAWLSSNGGASASDLCSDVTWSNNYEALSDDCGETGSATVEFTATDDCGNESKTTATFTIEDTTDPSIDTEAMDMTVECDGNGNAAQLEAWLSSNGGASASDLCSDVTWSNNYEALSDDCGATGSATVEFTATDDCGNESKTTATFTIEDTTDPSIDTEAMNMTVECDGNGNAAQLEAWLVSNGGASASDLCSDVTWFNNYEALSDDCGATGSATVEFTATDDCGNESKTTGTFTIEDTTDPSIDTEAMDMTVECDGAGNAEALAAWLSSNGGASASDMCSDVIWSNNYEALSDDCGATGSATVEFTATDDCGNESKTTATFTIEDTTDPTFDTLPENVVIECEDDLPNGNAVTASDSCGDAIVTFNDEISTGEEGDSSTECSTSDASNHTLWINNKDGINATNKNFVATSAGSFIEYPDGTAKLTGSVANTDNPNQKFDFEAWFTNKSTYTEWTSIPNAGSSTGFRQAKLEAGTSVTITDEYLDWHYYEMDPTKNNVLIGQGEYAGVELMLMHNPADYRYGLQIGEKASLQSEGHGVSTWIGIAGLFDGQPYSSNGDFNISLDNCVENSGCAPTIVTRTYTATDDCGNTATHVQTITIEDNTAPSIDTEANNMTVECDGEGNVDALEAWLANNGGADASDACGDVTWSNNYVALSDDCGETGSATVEFTATDDCGNASKTTATFTIEDTTPPMLEAGAKDIVTECGEGAMMMYEDWLAASGEAIASDSCGDVTWSYDVITEESGCGSSMFYIVIFTATDDCGNSVDTKGEFTIEDTTGPIIETEASDLTIGCGGNNGNCSYSIQGFDSYGDGWNGAIMNVYVNGELVLEYGFNNGYTGPIQQISVTNGDIITLAYASYGQYPGELSYKLRDSDDAIVIHGYKQGCEVTAECDDSGSSDTTIEEWLLSNGGASATDSCGDVTWSNDYDGQSEGCGQTIVTFTATDDCGNTSTTEATITIEGSEITLECPEGGDLGHCPSADPNTGIPYGVVDKVAYSDDCGNEGIASNYTDDYSYVVIDGNDGEITYRCTYNGYVTDYDFHYAGWHNDRPWYEGYVNGIYFQLYYYGSGWTMYCVPDGQHFWYTTNDYSYKVPCDFSEYVNNTNCSVEVLCEQTPDLVEHTLTRTFTQSDACGNEASCEVTYTWTTPNNNNGYASQTTFNKSDSNPCGIIDSTIELADGPGNTTADAEVEKGFELDFTAYPVPFDREVTIKFNFEFDTDVTINVHDTRGLLIKTEIMDNVRANSNRSTKLDLSRGGDQVFYVTVTTNKGSVTKKIVSSGLKRR